MQLSRYIENSDSVFRNLKKILDHKYIGAAKDNKEIRRKISKKYSAYQKILKFKKSKDPKLQKSKIPKT